MIKEIILLGILLSSAISGGVRFSGEIPSPDSFDVGLCNITENGEWCTYSVEPPAPKSDLDEGGNFRIDDVSPGWYGLVFEFTYFHQIMPWWPDESGEIVFYVNGTDNIDFGTLSWDTWPCELSACPTKLALPIVIAETP